MRRDNSTDGEMKYLTLEEAAAELRMCTKTLAGFLRAHPQSPPLYAKPGRDYIIAAGDVRRIFETMQTVTAERQGHRWYSPGGTGSYGNWSRDLKRLTQKARQQHR